MIVRILKSVVSGERLRLQDNVFTALEQRLCKQEEFVECLKWFAEGVLVRPDVQQVCSQGSFSAKELVYIFKVCIHTQLYTTTCSTCGATILY